MTEIKNITNIFNLKTETNEIIEIIEKKCTHYENCLQVFAKCCNKYYDCHLCHNEQNNHKLNRKLIKKIKCVNCTTENDVGNKCKGCNIEFAKNFCNICNVWCNKYKDIYHCYDCGFCRVGKRENYYHCNKCNLCLSLNCIDSHNCENIDKSDNCPLCLSGLHNADSGILILKCNHFIHEKCLDEIIKNTDKSKKIPCCLLCKKSVVNFLKYESIFDKNIKDYELPCIYQKWTTNILCNDCCVKSTVKYHTTYHKCQGCKSYNTTIIGVNK